MSRPGPAAMDDLIPLERELREALTVEPSPEFLPTVRERLAREQAAVRSWRLSWLLPAAAPLAIAAALLVAHRWPQPPLALVRQAKAPSTTTTSLPVASPGSGPSLASPVAVGPRHRTVAPAVPARSRAHPGTGVGSRRPATIEVPRDDELALQHFVDSIRGLHLGGTTVLAGADTLAPDPQEPAAGWPDSEARVRHLDEVAKHQREPVVMDD